MIFFSHLGGLSLMSNILTLTVAEEVSLGTPESIALMTMA